jgi:glycosyltransferase involved in cell wall biosynthesis
MALKFDFTVAICTYNGGGRIADVLEKLSCQVEIEKLSWEIIIVDNNSQDNTAQLIQQYQANWSRPYPLKYFFEPQQGLAFARRRAIQEAKSSLIGFLDDDNLPLPNWVAAAYHFGQFHVQAGAYGGQIQGDFEVEPPAGFERIARFVPIVQGTKLICYNTYQYAHKKVFPPGAGIVIRRQAWLESVPKRPRLPQIGEDIEALSYLRQAGWEIWFNPAMKIVHKIPRRRLEKDYLISWMRANGLSRYHTRMAGCPWWQKPIIFQAYIINDLYKLIGHLIKYWKFLKTDTVAQCELAFLMGSLYSPFYRSDSNYGN